MYRKALRILKNRMWEMITFIMKDQKTDAATDWSKFHVGEEVEETEKLIYSLIFFLNN